MRGLPWPFVARERELAEFHRAWARRGVVITGPAGVGASRLADECLATVAGDAGRRVTATRAVTAPLGAIAHLIPAGTDTAEPDAVIRAMRDSGIGVVLVEDAQHLDPASALVLRGLLDHGAPRLIATVRAGEACHPAVAALLDDARLHHLELAPFGLGQVGQVLTAALGGPVALRTVSRLFDASGGIVRYLRELTQDALDWDGELWGLTGRALSRTPALTELITARLAVAPAEARPVLEVLALCPPMSVRDAEQVAGPDALAAVVAAGLVEVGRSGVRLAHPLYAEVVRDRMSVLRRHLVLSQRADAPIEALGEPGSARAGQLVPMILVLADAGQFDRARAVAQEVLAAVASPSDWAWAAGFLGRVEWLAGDLPAARRWYAEAIAEAEAHQQIRPLVAACAGLAATAAALGDLPSAEAALAKQRRFGPVAGSEERLGEAWLAAARGDLARARAVLVEAAANARNSGQRAAELTVLTELARLGGAAQAVDRVAGLAESGAGPLATARSRFVAALAAGLPGPLDAAARALAGLGAYLLAAEAGFAAAAAWTRAGLPSRAEPAARRARDWAARCPGAVTPALAMTDLAAVLTAREREIALLAAAGDASKAIAATLGLSPRTVENHLGRVYDKIGVRGRRELARAMNTTSATGQAVARSASAMARSLRVPTPSFR